MASADSNTIKSGEKLLRLVGELTKRGSVGVTELADATSMHKSTVYVHLQTLKEEGIVVQTDGKYRLSLQFLTISESILRQRSVYRMGTDEIDNLSNKTGELACLGIPENDTTVIVHTSSGRKASQSMTVGAAIPMFESPMGKVILAFSTARVDGSISENDDVERGGSNDGISADQRAKLADIRRKGYCISEDMSVGNIPYIAEPERDKPRSESHRANVENSVIAVPILHGEKPVGAVSVLGSSKRLSGEYLETLRAETVQAASMIEEKLDVDDGVQSH